MLYVGALLTPRAPEGNGQREQQQRETDGQTIAEAREESRRERGRHNRVDATRRVHRQRVENARTEEQTSKTQSLKRTLYADLVIETTKQDNTTSKSHTL